MLDLNAIFAALLRRAARFVDRGSRRTFSTPSRQLALDIETRILWDRVASRTMTNIERIDALREAVEYVIANSIPGDIVECGVWRGGSMMAVALTLMRLGTVRRLWLYDTFSGMTAPGPFDLDFQGRPAADLMKSADPRTSLIWARSGLSSVQTALAETGYPKCQIEFIVGSVETTIPQQAPEKIALLRLDTDWFESTYHELVHLWPRLSKHGILIIDDYGDWVGAKRAVDQYFREANIRPFLHRIDGTARLVIKS